MKHNLLIIVWLLHFSVPALSQPKKFNIHTLAFYNFENLFDTINNPETNDEEWTPKGAQSWTASKYQLKLNHLAQVLSEIGTSENKELPTLIGGCEIENRAVLEDLIQQSKLKEADYGIIHFDSPDKRGIDVALLYRKKWFRPTNYSAIPLKITLEEEMVKPNTILTSTLKTEEDDTTESTNSKQFYTRDQLLVSGFLEGEPINLIINHWPSRSGGEQKTSKFREAAALLNKKILDSLQQLNVNAKIITMGDLNDGPLNKSLKKTLGAQGTKEKTKITEFFNPFEMMAKKGIGTIAHQDTWDIFDQILLTGTWLTDDFSRWRYWKAGIFRPNYLIQTQGKYKGYPLRHSTTEVGYSDHFPVYVYLIRESR